MPTTLVFRPNYLYGRQISRSYSLIEGDDNLKHGEVKSTDDALSSGDYWWTVRLNGEKPKHLNTFADAKDYLRDRGYQLRFDWKTPWHEDRVREPRDPAT